MLRQVIIFALLMLGGLMLIGPLASAALDRVIADDEAPQSAGDSAAPPMISAPGATTLASDGNGHFRASALVNGHSMSMIVDTGASTIVLRESDARIVGLAPSPSQFTGRATTAGGTVPVAPVTLDRVSVNGIERRGVAAVIAQGSVLPASLLGQSYLSQLGEVRMADGQMTLRN